MGEAESNGGAPRVSLTFDNGPTPGVTDRVLDLLGERQVTATFFAVGERLEAPGGLDLARRALDEGHRVGAHTMTHTVVFGARTHTGARSHTGAGTHTGAGARTDASTQTGQGAEADDDVIIDELARPDELLAHLGVTDRMFRPYGAGGVLDRRLLDETSVGWLTDHGYTCVLWNSVPHDWDDPDGWVDRALADIDAGGWTVPVVHDVDTGAMDHLPRLLDALAERDAELRQDFPRSCVPIEGGRLVGDLTHLMPSGRV